MAVVYLESHDGRRITTKTSSRKKPKKAAPRAKKVVKSVAKGKKSKVVKSAKKVAKSAKKIVKSTKKQSAKAHAVRKSAKKYVEALRREIERSARRQTSKSKGRRAKQLWGFEWVGGGWNTVMASSRAEAIKLAKRSEVETNKTYKRLGVKKSKRLVPDESSFKVFTSKDLEHRGRVGPLA